MEILLLTVFLSLLLAAFFLMLFMKNRLAKGLNNMEQDALRPFQVETPKEVHKR